VKLFAIFPELIGQGRSEADWQYFKKWLVEAWKALDQAKIDPLILSIGRRLKVEPEANGITQNIKQIFESAIIKQP
jgi:hypothetical protein